jgi:hypothetical protein
MHGVLSERSACEPTAPACWLLRPCAASCAQPLILAPGPGPPSCSYKWDTLPAGQRPERGLLAIRAGLNAFANLRPAIVPRQLADSSPLKRELVEGVDILIVRLVGPHHGAHGTSSLSNSARLP